MVSNPSRSSRVAPQARIERLDRDASLDGCAAWTTWEPQRIAVGWMAIALLIPLAGNAADLALPPEFAATQVVSDTSILIQKPNEPAPLEFDVLLPQQPSLRERDPKFDRILKNLPDLDPNNSVPFRKSWTENIADTFHRQMLNGPDECQPSRCVGHEVKQRRMQQMNTDFGPQDDWTWTPPSRSPGE